jgi:hypothetical protein
VPAFKHVLACGSMVLPIICIRFFRAPRGKTEYQQKSRTTLPQAKTAAWVNPVIDRL